MACILGYFLLPLNLLYSNSVFSGLRGFPHSHVSVRVLPVGISVSHRHPRDLATTAALCTCCTQLIRLKHIPKLISLKVTGPQGLTNRKRAFAARRDGRPNFAAAWVQGASARRTRSGRRVSIHTTSILSSRRWRRVMDSLAPLLRWSTDLSCMRRGDAAPGPA